MEVTRCEYIIRTSAPKSNGEKVSSADLINIGYMAGRYGISLDGDLKTNKEPKINDSNIIIDVNSCTCDLLEYNLSQEGISFDRIV